MDKKNLMLFVSLLAFPIALAQRGSMAQPIAWLGSAVSDMFRDVYVVYVLTFVLFFMLIYAVVSATAKMLPIFQKEEGRLNKAGNTFAIALALLACFGIFYYTRQRNLHDFLREILSPLGFFGALVIGFGAYAMIWYSMKDVEMFGESGKHIAGLLGMLLTLLIVGTTVDNEMMLSFVPLLTLIVIILLITSVWPKKKEHDEVMPHEEPKKPHDFSDLEHKHKPEEPEKPEEKKEWPYDIKGYEAKLKRYRHSGQFYSDYEELAHHEKPKVDFWRSGYMRGGKHPEVAILCPHGGEIRPGSEHICTQLVHQDMERLYRLYIFKSLHTMRKLPEGNDHERGPGRLFLQPDVHVFNDNPLLHLAHMSKLSICITTFHTGMRKVIVSSKKESLAKAFTKILKDDGVNAIHLSWMRGNFAGVMSAANKRHIVNLSEHGVQLQISEAYLAPADQSRLIHAIRSAIDQYLQATGHEKAE